MSVTPLLELSGCRDETHRGSTKDRLLLCSSPCPSIVLMSGCVCPVVVATPTSNPNLPTLSSIVVRRCSLKFLSSFRTRDGQIRSQRRPPPRTAKIHLRVLIRSNHDVAEYGRRSVVLIIVDLSQNGYGFSEAIYLQ